MRRPLAFVGALVFVAACHGKAAGTADGGSGMIVGDDACAADDTLDCAEGTVGFVCEVGDDPELEDPAYSCSSAQISDAGEAEYCCFVLPAGFGPVSCMSANSQTSLCAQGLDSYIYQCVSGSDPATLDTSLHCAPTTPDAGSVVEDYCCSYSGSSSDGGSDGGGDGGVPAGCTLDTTLTCAGGADGYACTTGDNPETEEPGLSCSTPAADSDGHDDYCCFFAGGWSTTTCEPDDDLTAVCPDPTSYGYQCDSGDDPTSYDSTLTCSTNTPDPDGVHDDYCCTY